MMDYYQELGVERTASEEEIRQAYKKLVRLLHPDRCRDDSARRLAGIQTTRLNSLLAVLANPARRKDYDRSLGETIRDRGIPWLQDRGRAPEWFWPALGLLMLINVVFLVLPHRSKPVEAVPAPAPVPVPAASRKVRSRVRADGRHRGSVPDSEPARSPEPSLSTMADANSELPQTSSAEDVRSAANPASPQPPSPACRFSGNWLFAPAVRSSASGLYPPEYIELRLSEEAGKLRGRYRARYRIPDRAISPAVAFEFEGPSRGSEALLPWSGPGGASGEVTLHLTDQGTLEVAWVANHIGGDLGLISGKATLIRRQE